MAARSVFPLIFVLVAWQLCPSGFLLILIQFNGLLRVCKSRAGIEIAVVYQPESRVSCFAVARSLSLHICKVLSAACSVHVMIHCHFWSLICFSPTNRAPSNQSIDAFKTTQPNPTQLSIFFSTPFKADVRKRSICFYPVSHSYLIRSVQSMFIGCYVKHSIGPVSCKTSSSNVNPCSLKVKNASRQHHQSPIHPA